MILEDSIKPKKWAKRLGLGVVILVVFILISELIPFFSAYEHYRRVALDPKRNLPNDVSPTEAIVVLTGDKFRIPKALELLRSRGSPLLIISGIGRGIRVTDVLNQQGDASTKIHEVWKKIIFESKSTSTKENAEKTAPLLIERGVTRVILVTSEYHMGRAQDIFRRVLPKMQWVEYPVLSDNEFSGKFQLAQEYLKTLLFWAYTSYRLKPMQ